MCDLRLLLIVCQRLQIVVDYTIMIRRHITEHILQALADTLVVLVNGVRQTGKSTLNTGVTRPSGDSHDE